MGAFVGVATIAIGPLAIVPIFGVLFFALVVARPEYGIALFLSTFLMNYPPALHYLRFGLAQRRNPGPRFDGVWYLEHHVEDVMPDQNPLLHYERIGRAAGLRVKAVHEAASTPE